MKIAVNTRLLLKNRLEGIGVFANETLQRIARLHPEHQFYFIFDRPFDPSFITSSNITPVVAGPQTRHPLLWYHWLKNVLPAVIRRTGAELFLSPDGFIPMGKIPIPVVNVIHDLNFEYYPDDLPFFTRRFYRTWFPRFARKCTRLATVSEYSKKTIISNYGIEASRIDVVYNGVQDVFVPMEPGAKDTVRQKYSGGLEYFLYVGSLHPRKNVGRLIEAYEIYRKNGGKRMKLLLAGRKMSWSHEDYGLRNMKFGGDVLFTGYLEAQELARLTASCRAMVYVPYFEGFGIPPVEAMRCGVPVIASNRTSLPEVCGEAALLTDPFSVNSIADALHTLSKDEQMCRDLAAKGMERSRMFTWEKSADSLWKCMMKAAS